MVPRHRRLQDLFEAALELSAEERTAFLDGECDTDADLRREVEELLAADDTESELSVLPRFASSSAMSCRTR